MHVRVKKAVGTVIIVVFLTVYCFLAMLLAVRLLPGTGGFTQLAFYAVAGLMWVVPVGALIKWMQRPSART